MSLPVSEKAAEILFNRYMLQCFGLGGAQLFAPTSVSEYHSGYDAKVVGLGTQRELYLQFKAPSFSARDGRFSARLTEHQHARLRRYPLACAFYVVGLFATLFTFNSLQAKVRTAEDFLKHFVCVDVRALPDQVSRLTFGMPKSHRHSPEPGYKTADHGRSASDFEALPSTAWDRGNTLIANLRKGEVGQLIGRGEDDALIGTSACAPWRGLSESDAHGLGTFVRVPA